MELGISLPTCGALATPANIATVAREVERMGFDSVWTFERLLRPIDPVAQFGGPPTPVPEVYRLVFEPLETLSYVAGLTSRIRLGTSIIDALLHPPVVLARRFATIDQFSGGRLIAGLGQGWMPQEFETANVPMSRIGNGMDESIAAMRACWGPDPVSYQGKFYRIAPSEVNPKPVQPHIPILLGAVTPAGIRRAARIADGLNPIAISPEVLRDAASAFRSAVEEQGRDPGSVTVVARANVAITAEPVGTDRPYLGGSPEQIADDLAALAGSGVDHVFFYNLVAQDLDLELELYQRLITAVRG